MSEMQSPSGAGGATAEGFECPSCGSADYTPMNIQVRSSESAIETGMYRCSRCTFGFLHPERYTRR